MTQGYLFPPEGGKTTCTRVVEVPVKVVVARTFDVGLINRLVTDPSIYPYISDDNSSPSDCIDMTSLVEDDRNHFLTIQMDGEVVGCWCLYHRPPDVLEMHTCLLPHARGLVMKDAVPQLLKYVFTRTDCMTLTAQRAVDNEAAEKFGTKVGLRVVGRLPGGRVKDGVATDLVLEYLPFMDWFMRVGGDTGIRARTIISTLAVHGQFGKAAYLREMFTSMLGVNTWAQ